jgi:hypothetical protein
VSAVETRDALVVFGLVTIPPGAQHRSTAALTSSDGVGWTLQPIWPDPDLDLSAVAWGNDRILMIGPDECGMSPDGLIWLWCPAPAAAGGATFRGVDWVGDRFVAVGAEGAIAWTVDASSWTAVSPPPTPTSLAAVVAGDGVVVAVGEDGSGVTTADWTTWRPWSTSTESWLLDVAWGEGVFVAVAADGTVVTSTDGSTWQVQRLPGAPPLHNVAWAGRGFVAASHVAAFTSRDGVTWTRGEDSLPLGGPAHARGLLPWRDGAVAVGGTSVVALEWSSPATIADRPQAWVVPAAAHAAGLGGTEWRTDVVLSNPGDVPAQLDLAFLERWRDGFAAQPVVNTLLPGTTARLGDLVRDTFGADSAGAVMIGSSRPLAVDSRTFNSTVAGTYGQRVPAVEVSQAAGAGERVVLPGLGRDGSRRTNLGAASLSGEETTVHFEIVRADGSPLGTIDLPLLPFSSGQLHDALAMVTSDPVEAAWAVAWSGSRDTRFVPYASVVDNATGDPMFVSAGRLEQASP